MKIVRLIALCIFAVVKMQAQNYQISFTGSGLSSSLDSVHVINLTTCASLSLSGTDTLHLFGSTGLISLLNKNTGLSVYPNPMNSSCKFEFFNSQSGSASIEVFGLSGRKVIDKELSLARGLHTFTLCGLDAGVYYIKVNTPEQKYTSQLVSLENDLPSAVILKYEGCNLSFIHQSTVKNTKSIVQMQYNDGEQLLFEGYSGNYPYVLSTLTPTNSQTVDFEFVANAPVGVSTVCSGNSGVVFSVTGPNNITYTWTYSGAGFSVASGQGTKVISVNFSASATSGMLSCTPSAACGNTAPLTMNITVNASPVGITASASPNPVCTGSTLTLTGGATGATSWIWTGPNGFTSSSQNPVINNITTASAGTYSLTVGNGNCTATAVSTLPVTVNNSLAQAGSIIGNPAVCAGNSGVVYSVPAITGATGYVWQYTGSGFSVATGANTNTITANFSGSATSGTLTVYGTNTCGNGAASPGFSVMVNPLQAAPGAISGNAIACSGATQDYSISPVSGATSYTWSVPSGATYDYTSLSTTTNYATTCVNQTGIGTVAWTNPNNAVSDNSTYATASLSNNAISNYLVATDFGFSIPADAVISGIKVEWEKKCSSTSSNNKDNAIRIVKNGTIGTTDKSNTTAWSNANDIVVAYGGSADLWGEIWTAADINASDFGAALSAKRTSTSSNTLSVDAVRITVYYTLPTGITVTFGSGLGNISVTANNAVCSSNPSTLVITGNSSPASPTTGTHTPSATQIVWHWNVVSGVTGYKYNTVNNYNTATDNGTSTSYTQTGLVCATAYTLYVWAYDTCNSSLVRTLNQSTSVCPPFSCSTGTVTDADNNTYNTISIGTQCWMKSNLNTGTRIDLSVNQSNNSVVEKYCYDNLVTNCDTYGGLYQWDELMQYLTTAGTTGVCPVGWHVPTDAEWATLVSNFPANTAGTALKQGGSSGFDALMGGRRDPDGGSYQISLGAFFWTSTLNGANAWYRFIDSADTEVFSSSNQKTYGFSLRCLKSN